MEILIRHYNASNTYEYAHVFYINNKRESSSVKLNSHFKEYIQVEDDTSYETIAFGSPSLEVAERLHALEYIDITDGVDVIVQRDFDKFKQYCIENILPKYEGQYLKVAFDEYDIDAPARVASTLYIDNFYTCYIVKPTLKETICAVPCDEVETIIDPKNIEKFKEDFYYCKIEEIKELISYIDEKEKAEFQKIIDGFDPETSFVIIEHLETLEPEEQSGRYSLLSKEEEVEFKDEELKEITSKMLALEKELNSLDRKRTELIDELMADQILTTIFDLEFGSIRVNK